MRISWMLLLNAAAAGLFVGAWGVAVGRHGLSELPPVPDSRPCTRPTKSSAPVGLRGYRRYFANDSLIGRPVPCTRDDKICFRPNLMFDPRQDRCEPIGGGRYNDCGRRPNITVFEKGGRIIGACKTYEDPCKGYRMAYDGRCYRKEVVRNVICGCAANITRHLMGGTECRSSPAKPIRIKQPQGVGRCLIPDLRFPDIARSQFLQNPYYDIIQRVRTQNRIPPQCFTCNSKQAACFATDKVWVTGYKGCYPLLKQGPCSGEHIVAMNIQSAVKGRAEATCVHVRGGCPIGHKRMFFDGLCHEDREIKVDPPGHAMWNEYGQYKMFGHSVTRDYSLTKRNRFCEVRMSSQAPGVWERRPAPPCGANDKGLCQLYDVEAEPPIPEL